jgi:alanyl-tRNA synthetase
MLVADGVIPSNEGRGYVLRRIVRRAIRHGYKLGQRQPFFHRLVEDLDRAMGAAYPELTAAKARVAQVLRQEEERFAETLHHGMQVLEAALAGEGPMLDGETVFRLYDTFGFPVDLTADICRERGIQLDIAGFEAAMSQQRERARAASRFAMSAGLDYAGGKTEFRGYDTLSLKATVIALYREGAQVGELNAGESGVAVLDKTPFYAESGGQVGDRGEMVGPAGTFRVADTQKIQAEVFGHHGEQLTGRLKVGDEVSAQVDVVSRRRAMWNHSATHLMHAALRKVLGTHERLAGRRAAHALRLLALSADDRGRDPQGRGAGERCDPPQPRGERAHHEVRRRDQGRRARLLRRQVRRRGARARDGRRLDRAVRGYARRAHRRYRLFQDRVGIRRGRRHPPR